MVLQRFPVVQVIAVLEDYVETTALVVLSGGRFAFHSKGFFIDDIQSCILLKTIEFLSVICLSTILYSLEEILRNSLI